jgi:hypothetical protein
VEETISHHKDINLIKIPDRISERPPRGGLSVCSDQFPNVRFWPKADIPSCTANVCFRGVKQTWHFEEYEFHVIRRCAHPATTGQGIGLKTLEKLLRTSRGTLLRRAAELGVSMAFNDAHDEPVDTQAVRHRDKLVDPLLERLMHVHGDRK